MENHENYRVFTRKLNETRESTRVLIILGLCFIYLFTISLISKGLYGDTDSIGHYNIARYAFRHPWLFVDHWGKPLFTALSAPFAQFGLQGSIFFNIICGLLSAWLIYRIAKELNFKYALPAIPFSLFAPIYMVTLFTSLTEILFSLVLVSGIYFFLKQKYILSAIIISLIPYARTEGLMFPAIFLLAFILARKLKAIPFLFTGFIIFSAAGYFHYHDFLWFFSAMPYSEKGSAIYGSGSFWYYMDRFHQLLGFPLTILAVLGMIWLGMLMFREKKPSFSSAWLTEYYLVPVSLVAFILVHSLLWWRGLMGVLASNRFMACIMPLCGLFAVAGFNFLFRYLGERKLLKNLLTMAIIGITLYVPYTLHQIPARLSANSEVMKAAANALMKIGYTGKRLLSFDPKLAFYLHEDPFNTAKIYENLPYRQAKDFGMADSSFLIWDAHFGEFENKIYLQNMLNNPNFRIIDGFVPGKEFNSLDGLNYCAIIFQEVPEKRPPDKWIAIDSIHKSNQVGYGEEFSFILLKKLDEFRGMRKVIFCAKILAFIPEGADPEKLNLVLEVHRASGEQYRHVFISASYFKPEPGRWFEMSLVTPLQTDFPENGSIEVYASYHGKKKVFVDDLVLSYIPVTE